MICSKRNKNTFKGEKGKESPYDLFIPSNVSKGKLVEFQSRYHDNREEFDTKKEISIYVLDSPPVTGTKVICENDDIDINREVTFRVETHGGKDINYEFYLMEKGNWIKVQEYSKKNYYTFIPFVKGEYRVLALVKSFYKKVNYEDYGEYSFKV